MSFGELEKLKKLKYFDGRNNFASKMQKFQMLEHLQTVNLNRNHLLSIFIQKDHLICFVQLKVL
jgi:hypothetical protein